MIRRARIQSRANHLKWLRRYIAVTLMLTSAAVSAYGPFGWNGPSNFGNGMQPFGAPWGGSPWGGSPYSMANPLNPYPSPWTSGNPWSYGQYPGWSQMNGMPYNAYSGYPTTFYRGPYGKIIGGVSPNGDFWFNMTFGGNSNDLYDFLSTLQASGYLRMNYSLQDRNILNQAPDLGLSPLSTTTILGL